MSSFKRLNNSDFVDVPMEIGRAIWEVFRHLLWVLVAMYRVAKWSSIVLLWPLLVAIGKKPTTQVLKVSESDSVGAELVWPPLEFRTFPGLTARRLCAAEGRVGYEALGDDGAVVGWFVSGDPSLKRVPRDAVCLQRGLSHWTAFDLRLILRTAEVVGTWETVPGRVRTYRAIPLRLSSNLEEGGPE